MIHYWDVKKECAKFDNEWIVRPNQYGPGDGSDGLDMGLLEWGERK